MKPNFALNITDSHLALLHRTSRGWMPVGEVAFDSPDLDEAIGYLRASALGLSPQGMTTKLVLPRSQILYTEVEAPGPDKASRRAQIVKALEGRTPYAPEELVFDWWGKGDTVQVAVVARETLEEAEAFAETHRLNPVSFVTIPDDPAFAGEPWFGASKLSTKLLPEGEKVTRDQDPVVILSRDKGDAKTESQAKAEASPEEERASADTDTDDADSADAKAEAAIREAEAAARAEAEAEAAAAKARAEAEAEALREAERLAAERAEADRLRAEAAARDAAEEAARKAAEGLSEKAATPTFASRRRDDRRAEPPLSAKTEAATETPPKDQPPPANAQAADEPAIIDPAPKSGAVPAENAAVPSIPADPNPSPKAKSDAETPTKPEQPAAVETAAALPKNQDTAPANSVAAAPKPDAAETTPKVNGAAPVAAPVMAKPEPPLPPKTPEKADGADGAEEGFTATAAMAKGPALRPDTSAPAKGPMVRIIPQGAVSDGKSASPFAAPVSAARPAAVVPPPGPMASAPKPAAKGASPAKRLAAMVTAAKIPGRSSADTARKPAPSPDRAASTTLPGGGAAAANGSGIGSFGERVQRQRGKPRYLGLALTGVLLIVLALIAAWSSVYLSSNETENPDAIRNAAIPSEVSPEEPAVPTVAALPPDPVPEVAETADPEAPATEDLAAVQSPPLDPPSPDTATEESAAETLPETALAEVVAEAVEETPAEPEFRPDMAGTAEPAARGAPSADTQDEIFLAAMDGPAPTFDAVALPRPEASPDAAPQAAAPPPPAGTRYEFEPDGTIRAGETGVVTPEGFWLIAARPPVLPPARPADAAPAEVAEAPVAAAPAEADQADQPSPLAAAETPGSLDENGTDTAFAPSTDVTQRRPQPRPASAEPPATEAEQAEDDAALAPASDSRLASLRPRLRPETLAAAATARRQTAEAASLAATAAAEAATGSPPTASLPVAISLRPAARPRDFSRAVAAAVAAATQPAAAAAPSQRRSAPADVEEEDEPEVVASAAPRIPTRASVAKQATFTNAINLSKINLIGVYGTANNRYALVRSPNGRYTKVKVGDRVDGGVVAAITSNELRYQKGGRMLSLAMPRG